MNTEVKGHLPSEVLNSSRKRLQGGRRSSARELGSAW